MTKKPESAMTLVESFSARIHDAGCFHIVRRGKQSVYKVLFPESTREQVREYIEVKKRQAQVCGSCLVWAVR